MKIGKGKDKTPPPPGSDAPGAQKPDAKVIETKALSDLAVADADKRLAAGEEDAVVVMRATGDQTSVSIRGGKELKVDPKSKTVKTTLRHVPELRAHGFEVVNVTSL